MELSVGDFADVRSHATKVLAAIVLVVVRVARGTVKAELAASANRQQPRVIADLLQKGKSDQRTALRCQQLLRVESEEGEIRKERKKERRKEGGKEGGGEIRKERRREGGKEARRGGKEGEIEGKESQKKGKEEGEKEGT